MPRAEIITVGTEMLLGQLVDTNTATIAKALADVGVDVYRQTSVGDNAERIGDAVAEAAARADIVIVAGGLGPTVDDMTRDGVALAMRRPLELDEPSLAAIAARFAAHGWKMAENNRVQAMFPKGALVIDNPNGSAPGFVVEDGARAIVAMPGPPRELGPMLHDSVIPLLVKRFDLDSIIVTRVLHTAGVGESDLDARIADLFRACTNPSIAMLAHIGMVDVKLTAKSRSEDEARAMIAQLEPVVRERLGDCIVAVDDGSLQQSLGDELKRHGLTIATAESCTGGLVSELITGVPGSSAYFRGGIIAYADDAKREALGVDAALVERHGAVSQEVAAAMALGARERLGADVAISVTGVAGPDGGTEEKPVGLVYVGIADARGETTVRKFRLPGDRAGVRRRAANAALLMAWRAVRS